MLSLTGAFEKSLNHPFYTAILTNCQKIDRNGFCAIEKPCQTAFLLTFTNCQRICGTFALLGLALSLKLAFPIGQKAQYNSFSLTMETIKMANGCWLHIMGVLAKLSLFKKQLFIMSLQYIDIV